MGTGHTGVLMRRGPDRLSIREKLGSPRSTRSCTEARPKRWPSGAPGGCAIACSVEKRRGMLSSMEAAGDEELIRQVIIQYLAQNLGSPDYDIDSAGISPDRRMIRFTLTFKANREYCCSEPGCHLGLFRMNAWRRLRETAAGMRFDLGADLHCKVILVTEEGAKFQALAALGLEIVSRPQRSSMTYREREAVP
jgi:hypothetical protein